MSYSRLTRKMLNLNLNLNKWSLNKLGLIDIQTELEFHIIWLELFVILNEPNNRFFLCYINNINVICK